MKILACPFCGSRRYRKAPNWLFLIFWTMFFTLPGIFLGLLPGIILMFVGAAICPGKLFCTNCGYKASHRKFALITPENYHEFPGPGRF